MTRQTNLHIVMFSALLGHGGGRETWLNNVLPRLLQLPDAPRVTVYYVSDDGTDGHAKIPVFCDPRVTFIETRLPVTTNKFVSTLRIAKFGLGVLWRLRKSTDARSAIIGIGTFNEGVVIWLSRLLGIRRSQLVIWIRGIWSKEINHRHGRGSKSLICWLETKFMRSADKLIANGNDTKHHYEPIVGRFIEAIPNAIDQDRFLAVKRRAFDRGPIRIAYIGRLSEEKGLLAFLQAIDVTAGAGISNEEIRFEIVGDGPLRTLAQEAARRHPGLVEFVGPLPNDAIVPYLEKIDAGVCLTHCGEGGGGGVSNGLLEIIAARRLVIAWDSVIFRQVIRPDQAYLVEEAQCEQLAQVFLRVLAQREEAQERVRASESALLPYALDEHVAHLMRFLG